MSRRFVVSDMGLDGLKRIDRTIRNDDRGYLSRFFCAQDLGPAGFTAPIVQINHTLTRRAGSVRGMHYQREPFAEDKFVSVLRGEVFDVAVDLRPESPTFLQWRGEILSADNHVSLFIPKGFAHGFQTLCDDCELIYLHTREYAPDHEGGIDPRDPKLAIAWPQPISEISKRDSSHPSLTEQLAGLP